MREILGWISLLNVILVVKTVREILREEIYGKITGTQNLCAKSREEKVY